MTETLTYDCFLCSRQFKFGHGSYETGNFIRPWEIAVCRICYASNWDGIVPSTYPHLIKYLEGRGMPIKLNSKGWLPWPT
jgi:hypothetical protein